MSALRKALAATALIATAALGAAMAIPTSASAAPATGTPSATAVATGAKAPDALLVAAVAAAHGVGWCTTCSNVLLNDPMLGFTGSLGVIHDHDGSYTHGNYDALLPRDTFTDMAPLSWTDHVAGFYLGPGWCAELYRSDDYGSTWQLQGDIGPGIHFIGLITSYDVISHTCWG